MPLLQQFLWSASSTAVKSCAGNSLIASLGNHDTLRSPREDGRFSPFVSIKFAELTLRHLSLMWLNTSSNERHRYRGAPAGFNRRAVTVFQYNILHLYVHSQLVYDMWSDPSVESRGWLMSKHCRESSVDLHKVELNFCISFYNQYFRSVCPFCLELLLCMNVLYKDVSLLLADLCYTSLCLDIPHISSNVQTQRKVQFS